MKPHKKLGAGRRRLRGSDWVGTDRIGRCHRPAEPGQCSSHRHARRSCTRGRAKSNAIRRGLGRPAIPPLTTIECLGGIPNPRPERYDIRAQGNSIGWLSRRHHVNGTATHRCVGDVAERSSLVVPRPSLAVVAKPINSR